MKWFEVAELLGKYNMNVSFGSLENWAGADKLELLEDENGITVISEHKTFITRNRYIKTLTA